MPESPVTFRDAVNGWWDERRASSADPVLSSSLGRPGSLSRPVWAAWRIDRAVRRLVIVVGWLSLISLFVGIYPLLGVLVAVGLWFCRRQANHAERHVRAGAR